MVHEKDRASCKKVELSDIPQVVWLPKIQKAMKEKQKSNECVVAGDSSETLLCLTGRCESWRQRVSVWGGGGVRGGLKVRLILTKHKRLHFMYVRRQHTTSRFN